MVHLPLASLITNLCSAAFHKSFGLWFRSKPGDLVNAISLTIVMLEDIHLAVCVGVELRACICTFSCFSMGKSLGSSAVFTLQYNF